LFFVKMLPIESWVLLPCIFYTFDRKIRIRIQLLCVGRSVHSFDLWTGSAGIDLEVSWFHTSWLAHTESWWPNSILGMESTCHCAIIKLLLKIFASQNCIQKLHYIKNIFCQWGNSWYQIKICLCAFVIKWIIFSADTFLKSIGNSFLFPLDLI